MRSHNYSELGSADRTRRLPTADIELALKLSELTNSYPPACGVKSTSPFHIQTMLLRNRIQLSTLLAR